MIEIIRDDKFIRLKFSGEDKSIKMHIIKDALYVPNAPFAVTLQLTARCNLSCPYCHRTIKEDELSTEEVKSLLKHLWENKVFSINVSGGEVLLRADALEIFRHANEMGFRWGISTNGILMTEDIARSLKRYGISSVHVSLDGPREIHNKIRGPNFDKVINSIKILKKNDIKVTAVTVINQINQGYFGEILDICEKNDVDIHKTNYLLEVGFGKGTKINLGKERLKEFCSIWIEQKKKRKIMMIAETPFACSLGPEYNNDEKRPIVLKRSCPAGFTTACITPNGDVSICSFCTEISLGNIKEKPFIRIWKESEILRELREKDISGCRARSLSSSGSLFSFDPLEHSRINLKKRNMK